MRFIFTEDGKKCGDDGGHGYKEFRERVHPGKVDEKYNFDDSVD